MEIIDVSKGVYNGFLKIDLLTVSDGKKTFKRELMVRPDAVAAIVYNTVTQKYLFTKQWRPARNSDVVEIMAGTLDHEGEDPVTALDRELNEELGYKIDKCEMINDCFVSPGGTSEKVKIYYVEVSEKISAGGGLETENENIETIELTQQEMLSYNFEDAKTVIGVLWVRYMLLIGKI